MPNSADAAKSIKTRAKPEYSLEELNHRPLLRPAEFAYLIGSSLRTVGYMTDRLFPGIRFGGSTWIDREQALAALKNFRQGPRKPRGPKTANNANAEQAERKFGPGFG
jgi:hypothetical protein